MNQAFHLVILIYFFIKLYKDLIFLLYHYYHYYFIIQYHMGIYLFCDFQKNRHFFFVNFTSMKNYSFINYSNGLRIKLWGKEDKSKPHSLCSCVLLQGSCFFKCEVASKDFRSRDWNCGQDTFSWYYFFRLLNCDVPSEKQIKTKVTKKWLHLMLEYNYT